MKLDINRLSKKKHQKHRSRLLILNIYSYPLENLNKNKKIPVRLPETEIKQTLTMEKDLQSLSFKELQEMYDTEEDPENLHKIMTIISDKWVASDGEEETFNQNQP